MRIRAPERAPLQRCEGLSKLAFRLPLGHMFPTLCQEKGFSKA